MYSNLNDIEMKGKKMQKNLFQLVPHKQHGAMCS